MHTWRCVIDMHKVWMTVRVAARSCVELKLACRVRSSTSERPSTALLDFPRLRKPPSSALSMIESWSQNRLVLRAMAPSSRRALSICCMVRSLSICVQHTWGASLSPVRTGGFDHFSSLQHQVTRYNTFASQRSHSKQAQCGLSFSLGS